MPGAYAHITLVNLASEAKELRKLGLAEDLKQGLGYHLRYAELGAVSPDYPYLAVWQPQAKRWADAMHYEHTNGVIQFAARRIPTLAGDERLKAIAWLCGYVSHVIGDVTIHPVVEKKVGPYHENALEHRICEMNQDVHIFQRLNIGTPELADHLDNNGIRGCVDAEGTFDPAIATLWLQALEAVYPDLYREVTPDPDAWHLGFGKIVDLVAEQSTFMALARHVWPGNTDGVAYPLVADIQATYIQDLETPEGVLHYDQVFDRAILNVRTAWGWISSAIDGDLSALENFKSWNLDTGKDESEKYGMWR